MTISRVALGILFSASVALTAQDLKYGLQAHVTLPLGDLKDTVDSKPGIGLGAHMTVDFGQGHVLRPRVDFIAFPDATVFDVKNKVNNLSLGADYLYVFEGKTGFYVLGGLAVNRWKVDAELPGIGPLTVTTTKLGYALGGGFAFNEQVSAELRYSASQYGLPGHSSQNASAFEVVAYYRF